MLMVALKKLSLSFKQSPPGSQRIHAYAIFLLPSRTTNRATKALGSMRILQRIADHKRSGAVQSMLDYSPIA
jgi:hypothetical protein